MNKKFLEISGLGKSFPTATGEVEIVKGFDLTLSEGEFVSIIGHSGCGKSTVLSIVGGLATATKGGVLLAGKEVVGAGPDRGIVFQAPCLLHWLTALENVLLGVDEVFGHESKAKRREIAAHNLELVGLGDAMDKRPAELSLGMRQRVGLARAFALSPKMLLLDEPFGMLDSLTRIELQDVLLNLWAQDKKTAMMVTHDVDEALFLSDRVVMMTSGPEARVGEILEVDFERPRDRHHLLEEPAYYELRARLIGFLENEGKHSPANNAPPGPSKSTSAEREKDAKDDDLAVQPGSQFAV
ncbi:MAG TPA: ABC transporter ATP-binding protein [Polyangiaceae bacterium]|jgi:nitrate ABC transporter ATP-binding subunit|nr:ABC transporter ATP-binding protein [Polyangiaceae bacterium]